MAIVGVRVSGILFLMMLGCVNSDLAKDKQECADQLVGLSACLPFVGGNATSPTSTCCTSLRKVVEQSKKCLCVLVEARNDPNLGLNINATLALSLPSVCHTPANVSNCPDPNKGKKLKKEARVLCCKAEWSSSASLIMPPTYYHENTYWDSPDALLHLAPNSTDAQVFEQFASTSAGNSSSASVGGIDTSSSTTVRGRRWLGEGMVDVISLWCLTLLFIIN